MNELVKKRERKRVHNCFWKQCVICFFLLFVIWLFYVMASKHVAVIEDMENICPDNYNFVFQVEEVRKEGKELILEGWAFELGKDAFGGDMEVWLYDIEEERIIYPKNTRFVKRDDVNKYFESECDYSNCGVVASFNEKKVHTISNNYEVIISDKVNSRVIRTGTYLCNGTLTCYLPENYKEFQLEGTVLEDVVNEGIMRVCRSDVGMYIFQYEDYLYWIADETCEFVNKESTYIDFMIQTTQPHFLPENRKVNGYTDDNLDFIFQNSEFVNVNGYRAAKLRIPSEYSITSITTGHRVNDEWVWNDSFRPYYSFEEEN